MANNPYVNKVQLADGTTVIDISDTTATASDVASGKYFYDATGEKKQGTASSGSVVVEDTLDSHGGTIRTITATTLNVQAKTNIDPTTSSQTITPDTGYNALSSVQINAMPSGTAGTPTASKGSVSNNSVTITPSVTNTTGYITGGTKTGTGVSVSASELVSGTLSVTSSGTKDVTNYASASIPAGTAGTPTASKGTVSNHSITVTPSVTNQTGFITGSTKTGTGVTVSASELVSGSQNITTNDTYDVTNLASVVVNVSGGGGDSKNVQLIQNNSTRITSTSYTKACGTITVSKAGKYDIYWNAYRTSSSGTWGTQWYKNNVAQDTAQTTFSNSYYQAIHLTNITLAKDDTIDVYGRSRGNSYYLYVGQLTIIEV